MTFLDELPFFPTSRWCWVCLSCWPFGCFSDVLLFCPFTFFPQRIKTFSEYSIRLGYDLWYLNSLVHMWLNFQWEYLMGIHISWCHTKRENKGTLRNPAAPGLQGSQFLDILLKTGVAGNSHKALIWFWPRAPFRIDWRHIIKITNQHKKHEEPLMHERSSLLWMNGKYLL